MLPSHKGSYQARPTKWRIGKSKNGALELAVEFALFGFWDGAQWVQEESEIDGYFYLVTKDNKINETTVKAVEDAFGWNRASGTQWFINTQMLPDCQVSLDFEMYNNTNRIKVKWLNTFDRDPASGIGDSDPQEVKSLDAQYGQMFRATARKPAAPAPVTPPAPQNPLDIAKGKAWAAWKAANPGTSQEQTDGFKAAVAEYFDNKPTNTLGARQFDQFVADGFKKPLVTSPIGEEQQFKEDDIPF